MMHPVQGRYARSALKPADENGGSEGPRQLDARRAASWHMRSTPEMFDAHKPHVCKGRSESHMGE